MKRPHEGYFVGRRSEVESELENRLADFYPIVLNLSALKCIVVGGGKVALRKIDALLKANADLTVVTPGAVEEIEEYALAGKIKLEKRPYAKGEASDYFLVIAATNVREVNEQISSDAQLASRLVNVVDVPDLCNFIVPSILRRNELIIAVSTSGAFPALSKTIRRGLEEQFPLSWEKLMKRLRAFRLELNRTVSDQSQRIRIIENLNNSGLIGEFLQGNEAPLEAYINDAIDSSRS